jgi:O-acetyl-ADP-ribose deacetylase (regulator of RNase III)
VNDAAFVSPANDYLSYGGGIDLIYNQDMFPDIQKVVMEKIGRSERRMILKRSFDDLPKGALLPYLPIGEAIITPLTEYDRYKTCYLISVPTMEFPMDIQGTDHPYKCFMAILNVVKQHNDKNKHQIKTIICPGLGTGVGGISAKESAIQIFDALNEYVSKN